MDTKEKTAATWQQFADGIIKCLKDVAGDIRVETVVALQGMSVVAAHLMAGMKDNDETMMWFMAEVMGDYNHATGRCDCPAEVHDDEVVRAVAESRRATKN